MSLPPNLGPRNGILSLTIKDKSVLYAAYMPFVRNGGLFIPTAKSYKLGDEVFMLLNLMDEPEKIPVAGKVVWITPKGAQGNRAAGVGVQFNDGDNTARNKIETYLAGALKSDRPTLTMYVPAHDLRRVGRTALKTASECSFTTRNLRLLGHFRHRLSLAREIVNRF